MPIYEYQASGLQHCDSCKRGFEVLLKSNDQPPETCPQCGAPVRRRLSAPNLSSSSPSLSEANLSRHGFTQYRKAEKGVYEKTTGEGPDTLTDK